VVRRRGRRADREARRPPGNRSTRPRHSDARLSGQKLLSPRRTWIPRDGWSRWNRRGRRDRNGAFKANDRSRALCATMPQS
jgi:hypothetical protein